VVIIARWRQTKESDPLAINDEFCDWAIFHVFSEKEIITLLITFGTELWLA
jgi:hypothetical protein